MATNTLHIRVRSDGTRVVSKEIKSIGESANLASRQIFLLRRAVQTLFAAAGVRAAFRAIEQFTELNNKLKTVTDSTNELIRVRKQLLSISNESRTALGATVQLYTRTTRAVERLGLSEEKRLKFTSLLTKESIVGGATNIEADNAIRQLTQGMGAAGLKGEELRSVLEQLPTVAERIADYLGVTSSELRKLGEEGELTGEVVIQAMLAAEDSINKAFGETLPTISQSFQVLKNNFVEFFGQLDEGTGISRLLSDSLIAVSENLSTVVTALTVIAGATVFNFLLSQAGAFSASIVAVTAKLVAMKTAIVSLGTAKAVGGGQDAVLGFLKDTAASSKTAEAASIARVVDFLKTGGGPTASTTAQILKMSGAVLAASAVFGRLSLSISEASQEGLGFYDTMLKIINDLDFGVIDAAEGMFDSLMNTLSDNIQIKGGTGSGGTSKANEGLKEFAGIARMYKDSATELSDALDKLPEVDFDKKLIRPERIGEVRQEIERLTKAQARLEDLYVKGVGGPEAESVFGEQQTKFALALKRLREEEDGLTGGALAATKQIEAQLAVFEKYAGDTEALAMAVKGATEEQILLFLKAKKVQEDLIETRSRDAASLEAARRAEESRSEAIKRTLDLLREENRLLGANDRQRAQNEFQKLNPSALELTEFKALQNQIGQGQTEQFAQEAVDRLTNAATRFAETSATLRQAVQDSPVKVQEDAEKLIADGEFVLLEAAKQLGTVLGGEIGAASEPMIEQARQVLVTGAGEIGTQAGAALKSSFLAALVPGIAGLGSQFPVGLGSKGGAPLGTEDQAAQDQALQRLNSLSSSLDSVIQKQTELNAQVTRFGPTAGLSFDQARQAAGGLGNDLSSLGKELEGTFNSIFGSLEDALVGFVTTGKLDFKSLINSILADLARMVVRMLIIQPLMGFFGGFFGGIFGFSGGGSVGGAFGLPGFNGGGFVQDNPAVPARFATGGRVHGPGTGVSDSVNALLSRDEFVVNAAASRPNMAGLEYLNSTGRMPGGGNVTSVAYAPNVSITVEGNSDNAAGNGAQIAKDFEQQMRAQFNEFVAQEQRPGGAFSKTNEDVI